ncbi:uncharacterized protein LOC114313495 [Camellia sinensis]|uniref:uncharacterized protein LOC114313495 n=1 Tax=Camellia sinensis TaxID=4442 RepID=UPI0010367E4F|nr:uncharacterized protein LOC114313495 [Camellia sinensis]
MCKVFPSSLGEIGLRWFDRLPAGLIRGWKQLSEEFLARFVSNTKIPKKPDTLFGLRKEQEETLRSYAKRYWEEYNDLEENVCSEQMAVLSFKHCLRSESKLRQTFTKRPATTLKDLRARIKQYARLKDDQIPIEVASAEQTAWHKKRTDREEHRGIAVNEVDKSKSHEAVVTVFKEPIYRILEKIKREPFFVWPPKMLGDPARRNQMLRCSYHQNRGHMTQNCRALKQHLEDLVAAGHFWDYIDQDKEVTEPGNPPPEPNIEHPPRLIINVIYGTATQEPEETLREEIAKAVQIQQVMSVEPVSKKVQTVEVAEQPVLEGVGGAPEEKIVEDLERVLVKEDDPEKYFLIGLDPEFACHKLNINPSARPIVQKSRRFSVEHTEGVIVEVEKLLASGAIREVQYPQWLSNIVVVKKKNGK